jgi:flavin reductase (DIM6/NTAB) family NADH-FMN oxidoreductase RutF
MNAITGIKPVNLIGTKSQDGQTNLAVFSSIMHLGSNPALLGFILRPQKDVRRHTYENILETRCYTINHIHKSFVEQAHYTSAKFEKEKSEFQQCNLTEEYLFNFEAPFVKESSLKIGLTLIQTIPIEINGTLLVIGQVEHIFAADKIVSKNGYIDLEEAETVGVSGLNTYYTFKRYREFPYARTSEFPLFNNTQRL